MLFKNFKLLEKNGLLQYLAKKVSFSPKLFERNFSQIRFKALGQINSHLLLALFTDSLHLFKCHSNLWRKTMKLRGRRRVVLVRIFHPKININPDTIGWGGGG